MCESLGPSNKRGRAVEPDPGYAGGSAEARASAGSGHVNARAIFDAALEIESPEQRQAYVNEACAGNTELRDKVVALLRAYREAGSFLERPAVTPIHTSALISS